MKTTIKTLSMLILAGTFLFTACKKKDDAAPEEETPTTTTGGSTTTGGNTTPGTSIAGSDGAFIGLKNITVTNMVVSGFPINTTVYSEIASANVSGTTGSSTLVDAGAVNCNDSVMTMSSNNSYLFNKKNSNMTSNFTTYFNSGAKWNIAGNSANSVPAFTYTLSSFPATPGLNLGSASTPTVNKSSSYTVNFGSIAGADSVICQIVGGNSTILTSKLLGANSNTSHTFTSAEMATLQASQNASGTPTGQVSVFAYKYGSTTVGSASKKYWFININAKTYLVHVQ